MPQAEQVLELAGRIAEHVAKVRQVGDRYVRLLTIHDAQLLDAQLLASVGQLLVESAKPHLPNNDAYVRSSLGHSLLEVGSARESVVTRHYP